MSSENGIATATVDGIRSITLDRPPTNPLAPDLMGAFGDALRAADADTDVRAIVVTGAGSTFCGGLDGEKLRNGGNVEEFASHLIGLLKIFPTLGKPVIAAINGDAVASGFSLVCATDIAISVSGAKLGTIESSMGLWPMIAQVPVLQRLAPRHAIRNVMTGIPFTPEEALAASAINEIVADKAGLDAAVGRWADAATRSGQVTAPGRRSFYRQLGLGWDAALDDAFAEMKAMFAK